MEAAFAAARFNPPTEPQRATRFKAPSIKGAPAIHGFRQPASMPGLPLAEDRALRPPTRFRLPVGRQAGEQCGTGGNAIRARAEECTPRPEFRRRGDRAQVETAFGGSQRRRTT